MQYKMASHNYDSDDSTEYQIYDKKDPHKLLSDDSLVDHNLSESCDCDESESEVVLQKVLPDLDDSESLEVKSKISNDDSILDELKESDPIGCVLKLIANYMDCDQGIPKSKVDAAWKAFTKVTGYQHPDLQKIFDELTEQSNVEGAITSFYMLTPLLILSLITIWISAWLHGNEWVFATYATVFVVGLLFYMGASYRINLTSVRDQNFDAVKAVVNDSLDSHKQSIAYQIQGLLAAACAITCKRGQECWHCNDC